jgi:acyl dehydratase
VSYAFEDFEVGSVIACGSRTVTAEEIIAFARQFDSQPFHVDEEAGKRSIYGSLIASGWHTTSMAMKLACDSYLVGSSSAGSATRSPSRSRPSRRGPPGAGRIAVSSCPNGESPTSMANP